MENDPDVKELKSKLGFGIKLWLEFDNKSILGSGWAKLLENIVDNKEGSLTQAAKECGYSYKYAWNILKRIENRTGKSPVITTKGGKGGGGGIQLTEWGRLLLNTYIEKLTQLNKLKDSLKE